ncbi:phage tail protein [Brevibacillus centrosporus]|uniref:phage tail protein n=1 Tax=Brevibacillus centrosporus TaxID=54910 RepID=UPI0039857A75
MDPYIGEIRIFAGNFEPANWAFCNGQLLAIRNYTALFSIIGVQYGGDGVNTFALPDLRGRAPIHQGQGPGLTPRTIGEEVGSPTATLNVNQIPAHTHMPQAVNEYGNTNNPDGAVWAKAAQQGKFVKKDTPLYSNAAPDSSMDPRITATTGMGLPHNNMQPYLGINFIICLQGVFPSRS